MTDQDRLFKQPPTSPIPGFVDIRKGRRQGMRMGISEGLRKGRQAEALAVVLRMLAKNFGAVEPNLDRRVRRMTVSKLEDLTEALLEIATQTDLAVWLDEN